MKTATKKTKARARRITARVQPNMEVEMGPVLWKGIPLSSAKRQGLSRLNKSIESLRVPDGIRFEHTGFEDDITYKHGESTRLHYLNCDRLRVKHPIIVQFTANEVAKNVTAYRAEAVGFNEFGHGASGSAALDDLCETLVHLYDVLNENRGHLGKDLRRVWVRLQRHVEERVEIAAPRRGDFIRLSGEV